MFATAVLLLANCNLQQLYAGLWDTEVMRLGSGLQAGDISRTVDAVLHEELRAGGSVQKSNRGGWHSRTNWLVDQPKLVKAVMGASMEFLLHMIRRREQHRQQGSVGGAFTLTLTSGWANVNRGSNINVEHFHHDWAAGALYLQTPEMGAELWLADPRPRKSVAAQSAPDHHAAAVQNLGPGEIVMFPAWVPHGVPPTNSAEPRVTVAFNVGLQRESGGPLRFAAVAGGRPVPLTLREGFRHDGGWYFAVPELQAVSVNYYFATVLRGTAPNTDSSVCDADSPQPVLHSFTERLQGHSVLRSSTGGWTTDFQVVDGTVSLTLYDPRVAAESATAATATGKMFFGQKLGLQLEAGARVVMPGWMQYSTDVAGGTATVRLSRLNMTVALCCAAVVGKATAPCWQRACLSRLPDSFHGRSSRV